MENVQSDSINKMDLNHRIMKTHPPSPEKGSEWSDRKEERKWKGEVREKTSTIIELDWVKVGLPKRHNHT